jgi:hypothetical protein
LYYLNPFSSFMSLYVPYYRPKTNTTQTCMPPVGIEPAIPASQQLQTHALDRAATGIGLISNTPLDIITSVTITNNVAAVSTAVEVVALCIVWVLCHKQVKLQYFVVFHSPI